MGVLSRLRDLFSRKAVKALWKERKKIHDLVVEVARAYADDKKIDTAEALAIGQKAYEIAKALGWL